MPAAAGGVVRATAAGGLAVVLWSLLGPLTALSATVPPLQLSAMAFGLATTIGLGCGAASGVALRRYLSWPRAAWVLGVTGLFGYHALYFLALRHAPPVQANLINYLWPLLIVVGAALLPGERLRWWHLAGAAAGLAGAVVLISDGGRIAPSGTYAAGYLAALAAAVTWAGYSLLNRRFSHVPTAAVTSFCAVTAGAATIGHLGLETTVWPDSTVAWLAVVALGLGPVGAAFYLWDHSVKRGDIRVLGALAYAAPLLSTLLLVALGFAESGWPLAVACALIIGGAVLAGQGLFRPGSDRDGHS